MQTYLSARVNDENADQQQGWEESTDASLVQLLRSVLAASAQGIIINYLLLFLALSLLILDHLANTPNNRYGNSPSAGDPYRHSQFEAALDYGH